MATVKEQATGTVPTVDELLARASAMVPALIERAPEANKRRWVHDETIDDFQKAGFFKIFQPKRYGGYELDYRYQVDLAGEIGRGCGSSAWVMSVVACHSWLLGMFPEQAQDDVWAKDPDTLCGSAFAPEQSSVKEVEGGYHLSGHWRFSSGIRACDWVILGAIMPREGQPPKGLWFLLPREDYEIRDAWFVSGLQATGSEDVVPKGDGVFVPEHRTIDMMQLRGGPTPGSAVNDGHIFRLPVWAVFPYNVFAAGYGIARGVIDYYVGITRDQTAKATGLKIAELPTIQLRVAEATAEVDCAKLLVDKSAEEFNRIAKEDGEFTPEMRVRYRRDTAYATLLCKRAINRIVEVVGAHGLGENTLPQRGYRDIQAVASQIALVWDVHATGYGRVVLGLPIQDPRL